MAERDYLSKKQIQEEFKVIGEVAEESLKKKGPLTFQLGITAITNGKAVTRKQVMAAFKSMNAYLTNAPEDWLFQPQIMVQSSDVAGSDMQAALTKRQAAKAALVKPSG